MKPKPAPSCPECGAWSLARASTRKTITTFTRYYVCANEHRFSVTEPRDFVPPMPKRARPPQKSFDTPQAKRRAKI